MLRLVNQPARLTVLLGFMMVGLVFSSLVIRQLTPPRDWLLYWAYQPQSSTWYLLDLERRFHTPLPTMNDIHRVAFSRQHRIAYAQISATDRDDLLLRDVLAGGRPAQPIVTGLNNIRYDRLQWSPDGRYLAFEAGRRGRFTNLHVWDGQVVRMVLPPELENRAQLEGVAWNPANELVFVARRRGYEDGQLYPSEVYRWDGSQTRNLSQTPDHDDSLLTWTSLPGQDARLVTTAPTEAADTPLFCKSISPGWALMLRQSQRVVPLVEGGVIYALRAGAAPLYCATE